MSEALSEAGVHFRNTALQMRLSIDENHAE